MKFKLIAGDFPPDTEFVFVEPNASQPNPKLRWGREVVHYHFKYQEYPLKGQVQRTEIVTEENKKKILGSVGWGTAGLIVGSFVAWPFALGGMIAGVLKGGNRKELCFACYLKDDKKFMAVADAKTYQQITSLTF